MKSYRHVLLKPRFMAGVLLVVLLLIIATLNKPAANAAPQDTPYPLVSAGVSQYTIAAPKIFWYSKPLCNVPLADDTAGPFDEVISRIATYGGLTRQLFSSSAGTVCGHQDLQIHSTIAADDHYVYWFNNDGLKRLPVEANPGDAPEDWNTLPLGQGELVDGGDVLYALAHEGAQHIIWRINKASGAAQPLANTAAGARALSYDTRYVYWLEGSTLRRLDPNGGGPQTIASGVSGYYGEGPRTICVVNCITLYYVLYSQGKQVWQYENESGNKSALYTAVGDGSASALIFSLVSDEDEIFFLENRAGCNGVICGRWLLQRIPRSGGAAATLHGSNEITGVGDLGSDGIFLFWQEKGGLWRLPHNASELPQVNVRLERIEVTQAVQNNKNSVPLIEKKSTFVRAHVKSDGAPVPGVTAWLYGDWPGGSAGPLLPVNNTGTALTVQSNPDPGDVNQSFLFELPYSWTEKDGLVLRVEVNPNRLPLEPTYADNDGQTDPLTFHPSPRLEAQFVGFGYELDGDVFYPQFINDVVRTYTWVRRTFPLSDTPGFLDDPSPGFRVNYWIEYDEGLGSRVDDRKGKQDSSCNDLPVKNRNSCAARYTNDLMLGWRSDPQYAIPSDRFLYGMTYFNYNLAPNGFPRGGATPNKVSSGVAFGIPNIEANPEPTAVMAGHEIAHTTGRQHPKISSKNFGGPCNNTTADGLLDPNFPHLNQAIGPADNSVLGFNSGHDGFGIAKAAYLPADWSDIMSYCGPNFWPSDYTYECIYKDLMGTGEGTFNYKCYIPPNASPQAQEQWQTAADQDGYLAVSGSINAERGTATLRRLRWLEDADWMPPLEAGPYALRQVDQDGNILLEDSFTPEAGDDGGSLLEFYQVVPFDADTRAIQVVPLEADAVLDEMPVSANPPEVSSVRLVNGAEPVKGVVILRWDAADADGDELLYDVLYSMDGGATGQPLMSSLSATEAEIDTELLGGSGTAVFMVIAHDGARTGKAQSAPFVMASKPLAASILTPLDGQHFQYGQLVNFVGAGDNPNSSLPVTTQWRDAGGTVLTTAPTLSMYLLPVGEQTFTLRVIAGRQIAEAEVTIFIDDDLRLPGPLLSAAPEQVSWFVAEGETELQTAAIAVVNAGGGDLDWTLSGLPPWLRADKTNGSGADRILLTADPRGLDAGESWTARLTIATNEEVGQSVPVNVVLTNSSYFLAPTLPASSVYLPVIMRP